jgi:hypothetical protein
MPIYKNVESQKIAVYVYDDTTVPGTDAGKTANSAYITAEIALDGAASAATNAANPTELEATDHPGVYLFELTQAETNADMISIKAKSSTPNILSTPVVIYTTPGDSTALAADVVEINGLTAPAVRLALSAGVIVPGTIDTGVFTATTTIFEADNITKAAADYYKGRSVIFTSGDLDEQVTTVTGYEKSGSNGKFTVDALTKEPENDDTFILV